MFTDRARHVLALAEEEARGLNHTRMGTEHLLLGLMRESDGLAAKALMALGVRLSTVRATVEYILERGHSTVSGEMDWTSRARKVFGLSIEESGRLNHDYVGTGHLLLGIVREGEAIPAGEGKGIAGGVLETLGLDLGSVRRQVLQEMAGNTSGDDDSSER
jgi:ATP-dependent Clp protease ATP-binding subunit ClpC